MRGVIGVLALLLGPHAAMAQERASDPVSSRNRRSLAGRAGSASVKSSRLAGDRMISMARCLGRFDDD